MFNFFGSKPTVKEQQRENDRALRKVGRDVERERRQLEREEKKLEMEIKKMAREGNNEGCKMLAKQLIQLRKQKNRTYAANSKIQSIGIQNKAMGANVALADAMSKTAKTMGAANQLMKPEQVAADMKAFGQASMKMEMTEEMINDTLDDMLDESGDEEESEQVVNKVLDEIGIEISGKMAQAPSAIRGKVGESSKSTLPTDEEIEEQLAKLRS
ncbi:charged multivesicular body protein 2b [Schistocerca americana]|uniref:charged multivesicular body protein 2b n=1 Tax=Schistocerca americana TaxID=7009 RepID=UPI001F4FD551|nr:charged multivesicular body protein 2b [Schistocerca americana]XP_047115900.1 charged multivesicular body protein 2b [Schistocerca piceifrons]